MQDNQESNYAIGKVLDYDNAKGTIIDAHKKQYTFLGYDLGVIPGDLVKFRPERKEDKNVAFFIERYGLRFGEGTYSKTRTKD